MNTTNSKSIAAGLLAALSKGHKPEAVDLLSIDDEIGKALADPKAAAFVAAVIAHVRAQNEGDEPTVDHLSNHEQQQLVKGVAARRSLTVTGGWSIIVKELADIASEARDFYTANAERIGAVAKAIDSGKVLDHKDLAAALYL